MEINKWGIAIIFTFICLEALPAEKITVANVTDQVLEYNTAVELHITATEDAIVNSTITLNHEDAWVFFDNIRASEVISNYLQFIRVNGQAVSIATNGRVAVYGQGSVVIPLGPSYQPLTAYSGEDFSGDSMKFSVGTYYTNLGEFENNIRSIRLKRGYMATLATNNDGTGYSRVFIADREDIVIGSLQPELNGTSSFIRVFKHEWVSKKGWCQTGGASDDATEKVKGTWFYSWSADQASTNNLQYTVIKQNAGWPGWSEIDNKANVSHVLGFNEPDRPDQSNMTLDAALSAWPEFMRSGLRIGSPATSDAFNGWSLFTFIDRCDELNYRVDYVAVHAYWVKTPQQWYNDLKYIHDRTGRPIWITEWNNGANWTNESWPDASRALTEENADKQLRELKAILQVLDTTSFVERYSIYNWVQDCRAIILADTLTPAGKYYAENPSQLAYNPAHEVISPAWNYKDPDLSLQYLSLSNKISLKFTDPNGSMTRGFKLEKKVNNGSYSVLYESDDISETRYSDDLDSNIAGRITYRLSIKTVYDDYVYSNEASYYQSRGDTTEQYGNFLINDSDWKTVILSGELPEPLNVITGIPSLNNAFGMTSRVNAISSKTIKLRVDPWNYLGDPEFTKSDNIALLGMKAGVYDFGGLTGEVASVGSVSEEWIQVNFSQVFEEAPVVFCTQVSNYTFFPTTPMVRNVTAEGFELCLRCEEVYPATSIAPETIHYLAVETGRGVINNKRIMVGKIPDDEAGISSNHIPVAYDSSYTEPAYFASLLSAEDDFASTLRYYPTGDHEITILKQRENSGQLIAMKKDRMGWMIMDFADGQDFTAVREVPSFHGMKTYPNPVSSVLFIDLEKPAVISVYDMYGRKLLQEEVEYSLDMSRLPAGIYFLRSDGYKNVKIIKE